MTQQTLDWLGPAILAVALFLTFVLAYVGAPALWLWLRGG